MPHPTTPCVVRHPVTGEPTALNPAKDYPADDAIVEAYAWAFAPVEASSEVVESVRIERATAEPGERRRVRKPRP